jgi:adenine-specific DNA-methyltransferase
LENLNIKKWRLLKSDEQKNIKAIETIGTPIGKLFDICVGIATLKDDVYFVDGSKEKNGCYIKETENGVFEIEKNCVKPVYKISDFKSQEEAEQNSRKIIFPYFINNGSANPYWKANLKRSFQNVIHTCFLKKKDFLEEIREK